MLGLDKRESFVDSAVGSEVLPTGLQVFTLQRLFTQRVPSERPAALVIKHDTLLSSAKDVIVMVRYKIIIANIPILQNDLQFVQVVISTEVVQYRTQTVFIPRKIIPWPS